MPPSQLQQLNEDVRTLAHDLNGKLTILLLAHEMLEKRIPPELLGRLQIARQQALQIQEISSAFQAKFKQTIEEVDQQTASRQVFRATHDGKKFVRLYNPETEEHTTDFSSQEAIQEAIKAFYGTDDLHLFQIVQFEVSERQIP